jgi:hypothetical protein
LSEKLGIDEDEVARLRAEKTTSLITSLELQEEKRIEHEAAVPSEALEHRIDPEVVHELAVEVAGQEGLGTSELTDFVEALYQSIESREKESVHYAEMYDVGELLVTDRLRDLAGEIRGNREDIERELNARLGLDADPEYELRVAVTDDRLYYWHVSTSPDRWLNVLAGETFYFHSKEDKYELLDDLQAHLHVRGGPQHAEHYLNDIVNQLGREEGLSENRVRRYGTPYYIDGEALHLIGDVLGQDLEDLKPRLSHLGMKEAGRVSDLQFPEIHVFRMRFVATIESDGHLSLEYALSYYEKEVERRRIVVEQMKELGEFNAREDQEDGKRVSFPRPLSKIAEYFGIPIGSKAIHNKGLDESVINAPLEVKVEYPREMVGEDGCFSNGQFSIVRHNVLHPGDRTEAYRERFGIEPLATQKHIEFVCRWGKDQKKALNYKEGEVVRLKLSELVQLEKSEDIGKATTAKELLQLIDENPNGLLGDEKDHILEPLGIEMTLTCKGLFYYRGSGRLSVGYTATTKTVENAIRWSLIAPPNHPRKMRAVVKFVEARMKYVNRLRNQIVDDGLNIHPVWEEYGI